MFSKQALRITSSVFFSVFLQALLVSGCDYEYPGCSTANCTALDASTLSDSNHGVYGDYFVNGVTKTSSGYGDNVSPTGLADLGCYTLPAGYATNKVVTYPLTCAADASTAANHPDLDSLFYVKNLGTFTKISACCNACRQANGCVFWRYLPYPKLPNGICFWTQTNLTQLYTTTVTKGVTKVTKSGVSSFSATTSNPYPTSATSTKNANGTYTCTVPLSVSGGNCRTKVSSTVINDPHLKGAKGTNFDFNGDLAKTFCLLSDKRLHVNMLLDGYLDARTEGAHALKDGKAIRSWIKELGVIYMADGEEHKLHLVARKSSEAKRGESGFLAAMNFNGQPMGLLKVGEVAEYAGGARLTFLAEEKVGSYDVDSYSLLIPGLALISIRMRVAHPLLRTLEDAQTHFNVGFDDLEVTPSVHGVLGQTYRANSDRQQRALKFSALNQLLGHNIQADAEEGEGFLDGKRSDYISSQVTATDCAFSAFEGAYKTLDFVLTSVNVDEEDIM